MGTRKITQVIFKEGVGRGSYKSFDIKQPVLNTGAKITDILMTEENRGVMVQWTDHHTERNALLVPYGNIKCITYDIKSLVDVPVEPAKTVSTKRAN